MKKLKLGRGNVAPAQGYFARYDPSLRIYGEFAPIDGTSIVNSIGDIVLGPRGTRCPSARTTATC